MQNLLFMITIVRRGLGQKFIEMYQQNELPVILNCMGDGTASSEILDCFGIEKTEKDVIFSIISSKNESKIMSKLIYKMQIDVPGTGIAFTVPIRSVGGSAVLKALMGENITPEENKEEKQTMPTETEFELIMAIAQRGYSDEIMDAARSAGATGGTVIHAKGTGSKSTEKFFGISIAEEKEMILIVSKSDKKNEIMKSVLNKAGPSTEAKTVLFSLPVSSIAGLRLLEEEN